MLETISMSIPVFLVPKTPFTREPEGLNGRIEEISVFKNIKDP